MSTLRGCRSRSRTENDGRANEQIPLQRAYSAQRHHNGPQSAPAVYRRRFCSHGMHRASNDWAPALALRLQLLARPVRRRLLAGVVGGSRGPCQNGFSKQYRIGSNTALHCSMVL
jgi:hypothetical protein